MDKNLDSRICEKLEDFYAEGEAAIVFRSFLLILGKSRMIGQNDSNVISLYTQALATTGNRAFTVAIVPLGGEYETDNNSDFNITVSAPSTSTTSDSGSGGGGGGGGGPISGLERKTDTIDEENNMLVSYNTGDVTDVPALPSTFEGPSDPRSALV